MTDITTPYLLESAYDGDEEHHLTWFSLPGLLKWLTEDIQHAHYSGDGHTTVKIARYDATPAGNGPGTLTELRYQSAADSPSTADENDYFNWRYVLVDYQSGTVLAGSEFTVRIDGRA
jgi:hypothetical protein